MANKSEGIKMTDTSWGDFMVTNGTGSLDKLRLFGNSGVRILFIDII